MWQPRAAAETIPRVDAVALLGLLVLGVVVLTPVADRIGVPQPVLLTIYGLVLGLAPVVPAPDLEPDLILPLVLPPLLFAATQSTSLRELRTAAKPILGLAVGLTLATAALVAVVGHALGLPWAVAVVLGGIVAPPDPVAATAVASRLHLPPRLVTILEGEGQFNDATALVVYQLSVMAVVAGGVGIGEIGLGLLVAVAGGIALGFLGGWLARRALGLLHDAATETTVTIAVPFALYLIAEEFEASGVLAVLVSGLYLRTTATREITSAGWLLGRSVWEYVEFAVSGLLFAFLGVEMTKVLERHAAARRRRHAGAGRGRRRGPRRRPCGGDVRRLRAGRPARPPHGLGDPGRVAGVGGDLLGGDAGSGHGRHRAGAAAGRSTTAARSRTATSWSWWLCSSSW